MNIQNFSKQKGSLKNTNFVEYKKIYKNIIIDYLLYYIFNHKKLIICTYRSLTIIKKFNKYTQFTPMNYSNYIIIAFILFLVKKIYFILNQEKKKQQSQSLVL